MYDSIHFYRRYFTWGIAVDETAYFELAGLWIALNEEKDIPRNEIHFSYTHIAFTIDDSEIQILASEIKR